jgi:hypothetical protein
MAVLSGAAHQSATRMLYGTADILPKPSFAGISCPILSGNRAVIAQVEEK